MIQDVHSETRSLFFPIPESKKHRIPYPDPQLWLRDKMFFDGREAGHKLQRVEN
jgi:hypothetical protein